MTRPLSELRASVMPPPDWTGDHYLDGRAALLALIDIALWALNEDDTCEPSPSVENCPDCAGLEAKYVCRCHALRANLLAAGFEP